MNRYIALDAFRGFTIALMILVITPGSWSYVYPPLLHANWHGWTPTDLVFPFFMFIIGSAMYFSFKKKDFKLSSGATSAILKRSIVIFLLGLALNAFPTYEDFESLRLMSVLGRIGIAYGLAAMLVLLLNRRNLWLLSIITLVGYWLLLASFGNSPYSLEGNLVRELDIFLLGESHMWSGKGLPFDPEGLLSTLPALVSIFAGFEATRMITNSASKQASIKALLLCGITAMTIGYLWHLTFPINKYLWTSSYVLVTSAVACWLLAAFIWLIDIKGHHKAIKPLLVYGMNPLFIYVFAAVWVDCYRLVTLSLPAGGQGDFRQWLFEHLTILFSPMNASLVYALVHVMLFWMVCLFLYKRDITIKI